MMSQKYKLAVPQTQIDTEKFRLLKDVPNQQVSEFLRIALFKSAKKGEVVYSQGVANKILFIHSGAIKLIQYLEESDSIKELLTANDIFGDLEDVSVEAFDYAKVLTFKATYFEVNLSQFMEMICRCPAIARNFYLGLVQKVNRWEDRCYNLSLNDARERLLYFLRGLNIQERSAGNFELQNLLTQKEIAKMINVSRQTLSRVLKDLQDSGDVTLTKRKIELNEAERFKKFAERDNLCSFLML